MTPQQADKLLQEIGLFETKSGPEHYEKGVQLIGEDAMLELGGYFNDEHENAEEYLKGTYAGRMQCCYRKD